jgi:hypothetical protein
MPRILQSLNSGSFASLINDPKAWAARKRELDKLQKEGKVSTLPDPINERDKTMRARIEPRQRNYPVSTGNLRQRFAPELRNADGTVPDKIDARRLLTEAIRQSETFTFTKLPDGRAKGASRGKRGGVTPRGLWTAMK